MTSNIAGEVDNLRYVKGISSSQTNMKEQVNYETLTNYWNQHQVFHLSGTASKADLEVFIKTTKRMNESVKIYDHNLELFELGINKLDISNLAKEYE